MSVPRRGRHPSIRPVLALIAIVIATALGVSSSDGRADDSPADRSSKTAATSGSKAGSDGERPVIGFFATTYGRSEADVVLVQYWSKGPLFRSETLVAGHPIVTLVRGDEYYTWDALTQKGYVVKRSPAAIAADARRARPFGNELDELLEAGGEKISSETLGGVRVDVYRVTDEDGRRTLWVDAERLQLPIRLETYDRTTGRTGRLDWLSWIPGLVIPDAFFAPPKDVELQRYESYQAFLERLARGPTPPTPPLFHSLLHVQDGS